MSSSQSSTPLPVTSVTSTPGSTPAAPPSGEERQAFAKLEYLKDIRSKTLHLEKLRSRLFHEVDSVETEDKCLAEFRREMELLQQEKMAHVEELRQIHADINALETVMKQAEESKRQSHDSARRVLEDFVPLKHDVDLMRTELLGLEKLPELQNDEKERLATVGVLDKPKHSLLNVDPHHHPWHHPASSSTSSSSSNDPQTAMEKAAAAAVGHAGFFGMHAAAAARNAQTNPFLAAQMGHFGPLGAAKAEQLRTSLSAQASSNPAPPPFRQQPPPMKSCLSCHQQIHRNAPICPLCKAKSRSRNPKKPKKKE